MERRSYSDSPTLKKKKVLWMLVILVMVGGVQGMEVSYDERSLIVNGNRTILFSGSIHYPRSTPEMWPFLIAKAKKGGLDVIQTYVFWNVHEPTQGQYNFEGRYDLVGFLKQIQAQGLYASLRIGPFIESEWNYGGFPFWLHDVPGIVYRSDNEPFKFFMQNFTTKIVNLMKSEQLYASQGGPIILSQIENEYMNVEPAFHEKGPPYVRWAAKMAVGLQTGAPWVMCKQDDAPDPVINTCNGMNCGETFAGPNSPTKPSIWTENWTSFYQVFGGEPYIRSAQDIAFAVALFIAKNGSFVNYYMYHGGTNFGRSSSSFVTTSYYDQAPIDEYGMIRQPKWGHLKELHTAVRQCMGPLLWGASTNFSLGQLQEAYVFEGRQGECAAFLSNGDLKNSATIHFRGVTYELPKRSISILPDCKNVVFNTAKVSAQSSFRSSVVSIKLNQGSRWEAFMDEIPNFEEASYITNNLLEQTSTTKDISDYLWYTLRYNHNASSSDQAILHIDSHGHVLHVYVNNIFVGSAQGRYREPFFDFENHISLQSGINNISLLSVMVGLPDSGPYLESRVAGIYRVRLQGSDNTSMDLSNYHWGYQIGLVGEKYEIYAEESSGKVKWKSIESPTPQPLMWYKTTVDAPVGNDPVALNLQSMGKGQAWVNGQSIGRYWVSYHTPRGEPSQTLYHVPRSFLRPSGNLVVLFEESGGDPLQVSLDTISVTRICGEVSESHPPSMVQSKIKHHHHHHHRVLGEHNKPRVHLKCPRGRKISTVDFASFGTPLGLCGDHFIGRCHSFKTKPIVEKACLGRRGCTITVSIKRFGGDPCPGISKSLTVDATCS